MAAIARDRDCLVAWTACSEDDAVPSFWPIVRPLSEAGLDRVSLTVTEDGQTAPVLVASGSLSRGNLQAHASLGPVKRECDC